MVPLLVLVIAVVVELLLVAPGLGSAAFLHGSAALLHGSAALLHGSAALVLSAAFVVALVVHGSAALFHGSAVDIATRVWKCSILYIGGGIWGTAMS